MKLENGTKRIPKIKYFKEMLFLRPCVPLTVMNKFVLKDKIIPKETTQNAPTENEEDYESDDTVEFSVSQNDLDEDDSNIDSKENIFVELSDTEDDNVPKKRPAESTQENTRLPKMMKKDDVDNQITTTSVQLDQSIVETISSSPTIASSSVISQSTSPPAATPVISSPPATSSVVSSPQISSPMCEDRIFGDLVTAMLMKLDEQEKRIAKRKIMEILL